VEPETWGRVPFCLDQRAATALGYGRLIAWYGLMAARLAAFYKEGAELDQRPCLFLLRAMSQRNAVNRAHQGARRAYRREYTYRAINISPSQTQG